MLDDILDKYGMVEHILHALNEITISGSKNVVLMSDAFQMLFALQKGLKEEDNAKNKTIETLKEQLKRANEKTEKDGAKDGNN